MPKVTTLIFVESRYRVDRKKVKRVVERVLTSNEVESNVTISIGFVGDRKMSGLNKKFRQKEGTTNILTFPLQEGQQTKLPPTESGHLGDIVLSYPQVVREAARDELLVDERIAELVEHGLHHLLGIHHE